MKLAYSCSLILIFCILISAANVHAQSENSQLSEKQINAWFKKQSWLSGLKLKPHKSIDRKEFARQYLNHKEQWDKAFAFLKNQNLRNLKPGKYEIDGDKVFATVTEAPSKTFEESTWESHRKYQDIQYVIRGEEKIGVASIASANVTKHYNAAIDAAFYTTEGSYYAADPTVFFIFFPENLHRPNIKVEKYPVVKKVVVKVLVSN